MGRTFTFVSPVASAWGETVLGIRAARELLDRGHRVVFAVPRSICHLLDGTGVETVALHERRPDLRHVVPAIVSRTKSTALVLVDESSWAWRLADLRSSPAFLNRLDVPVAALDVWNVHEPGFEWDRLDLSLPKPASIAVATRLRPVPFLRPTGIKGAYNALPQLAPTSRTLRRRARSELGLGRNERLILLTSAKWQSVNARTGRTRRLADLLPWLVAALLGRAGGGIRVMHIGPERNEPLSTSLTTRYCWSPQLPPRAFERVLRGADLVLSFNASSTATMSAVALGVPVLTGVNSHTVATLAQARNILGADRSHFFEQWIRRATPIPPFAIWPIGFFKVMARALARNPYRGLLHLTEVLDEGQFVADIRSLLYDSRVRRAAREDQASYCAKIARLARAGDMIAGVCA